MSSVCDVQTDQSLLNKYVSLVGKVQECTHDIMVGKDQFMSSILLSEENVLVKLKLWDCEQRFQAKKWCVGQLVQCSGVRVEADPYKGNFCLAGTSKTVLVPLYQ